MKKSLVIPVFFASPFTMFIVFMIIFTVSQHTFDEDDLALMRFFTSPLGIFWFSVLGTILITFITFLVLAIITEGKAGD